LPSVVDLGERSRSRGFLVTPMPDPRRRFLGRAIDPTAGIEPRELLRLGSTLHAGGPRSRQGRVLTGFWKHLLPLTLSLGFQRRPSARCRVKSGPPGELCDASLLFHSRGPEIGQGFSDQAGQELPDISSARIVACETAQQIALRRTGKAGRIGRSTLSMRRARQPLSSHSASDIQLALRSSKR
jgi:hypothetical protein